MKKGNKGKMLERVKDWRVVPIKIDPAVPDTVQLEATLNGMSKDGYEPALFIPSPGGIVTCVAGWKMKKKYV